jgi:hypothetical protein
LCFCFVKTGTNGESIMREAYSTTVWRVDIIYPGAMNEWRIFFNLSSVQETVQGWLSPVV